MRKVAVFGNAGGGKSTLSKSLSLLTGLPLFPLDLIQYRPGGRKIAHDDYLKAHADLLRQDSWIIDGYGCTASAWQRFGEADTLILIDLPLLQHRWWVTKRLMKGLVRTPEGWPAGSPILRSTLDSYRVVGLCNRHLTPKYRELIAQEAMNKRVHHLRSSRGIRDFLASVKREM